MKVVYVVRSLLFYLIYIPLVGFFGLFSGTLGWLLPFKWRQNIVALGNYMMLGWFGLSCGVKVQVTGLKNIPTGPFVALSKHQSGWETYYLQAVLRPVCTILKKELLRYPFFGWGLAAMRPIAIDRSNPREALRQVMQQGQNRISEGNNVVIYPEGTRTDPGQVGNYGRSGAALAIASSVPILPIAHNAGTCWPARKFIKYPGTISVVIGEAIATKGQDSKVLTAQVQEWIEARQKEIG